MASYYDDIPSSPEEGSTNPDDAVEAAILFSRVVNEANIKHGFMGGFACRILGGTRYTEDVDCCVEAKWLTIRAVLEDKKEFTLPKTKLVSGAMRIYAKVESGENVQIDIMQSGEGAGPKSLDGNLINVAGLPILNYTELVRAKLRAFSSRAGHWDGQDIIFLLSKAEYTIDKDRIKADEVQSFLETFNWGGYEHLKGKVTTALIKL